jgi:hypothetical protein
MLYSRGWAGFDIGPKERKWERKRYAFVNVYRCESSKENRIGEDVWICFAMNV